MTSGQGMDFHLHPPARPTAISLTEIAPSASPEIRAEAQTLLREYAGFLSAHPETALYCSASLEAEASRLPFSFIDRGGGCMIARASGEAGGFVAWREAPGQPRAWEIKRLWVRPAFRRLGMGRALLEDVLRRAARAKRTAVYLDTVPAPMAAAVSMYGKLGFEPCPPYNGNAVEGLACFRKAL